MATLVTDRFVEDQIRAERARSGGDKHDEVWEGIYMMTPLSNLEHQDLVFELTAEVGAPIKILQAEQSEGVDGEERSAPEQS